MLELARPEDRDGVHALRRQVHAFHAAWRPEAYRMEDDLYPEEEFLADIRERRVYTAKQDGNVVGYVRIALRDCEGAGVVPRRVLVLSEICVEESLRDLGYGTRMMQEVWAIARAFGCGHIQLSVQPENDAAVALYRKCGFTISSVQMQLEV